MPLYEYKCSKCHKKIEVLQKVGETAAKKCPYCGGPLKKLLSTPAIQFKGSGWYVTDYAHNRRKFNSSPQSNNHSNKKKKQSSAVTDSSKKQQTKKNRASE